MHVNGRRRGPVSVNEVWRAGHGGGISGQDLSDRITLLPAHTLCRVMRQSTLLCGFSIQAVDSVVASEMDYFM